MARKTHIVIHHSQTEDSGTVSWSAIRDYHARVKGYRDIGYHVGTELVKGHYETIMGRDWTDTGAHCKAGDMNKYGIGWCVVGNYDLVVPNAILWSYLASRVAEVANLLGIHTNHIIGHREAEAAAWGKAVKTCPGTKFDMDEFRRAVQVYRGK